jgi:hypothetical protein
LTTGGRPSGLSRFACPTFERTTRRPDTGDLTPWLPDGGGRSDGDSFALPCMGTVWELSPVELPDGAGVSLRGLESRQEPLGAAFIGLPYPSPGRGLIASRRRFGRVPAVAPMARGRPAGNRGPGRGQVRRRLHPGLVDVQPCTACTGVAKIDQRPTDNQPAAISVAQKTLRDSTLWGFLLYGADNQFTDYATSTGDISRPYSR